MSTPRKPAASRGVKKDAIRVFVVDDHPLFRSGLVNMLREIPDMQPCGQAGSYDEALRQLPLADADVALVDLGLVDRNGLELIAEIHKFAPDLKVIVLSMREEGLYAPRAIQAGAQGYIMKTRDPDLVVDAIRNVMAGRVAVSSEIRDELLAQSVGRRTPVQSPTLNVLSDRELAVLELLGDGRSTDQIARKLHISRKTVETYYARIRTKLNVRSIREVLRIAYQFVSGSGS